MFSLASFQSVLNRQTLLIRCIQFFTVFTCFRRFLSEEIFFSFVLCMLLSFTRYVATCLYFGRMNEDDEASLHSKLPFLTVQ
jgi:hypothetical protein